MGEQNEENHDEKSMDCLKKLSHLIKGEKVKCHVLLESQIMYGILQSVDVEEQIKDKFDFLPFNFNEIWAQEALGTIPAESIIINGESGERSGTLLHAHLVGLLAHGNDVDAG